MAIKTLNENTGINNTFVTPSDESGGTQNPSDYDGGKVGDEGSNAGYQGKGSTDYFTEYEQWKKTEGASGYMNTGYLNFKEWMSKYYPDAQIDWDAVGDYDSGVDPNADAGSIPFDLDALKGKISDLQKTLYGGGTAVEAGYAITDLLGQLQSYLNDANLGLNKKESLNMATQLYNTMVSYTSQMLSLYFERENWTIQSQYNSPVNQIARLMEAGINPAFYYGCMGQSDADSIGSTSSADSQMQGVENTDPKWQRYLSAGLQLAGGASSMLTGSFEKVGQGCSLLSQTAMNMENLKWIAPNNQVNNQLKTAQWWATMKEAYNRTREVDVQQQNANTNAKNAETGRLNYDLQKVVAENQASYWKDQIAVQREQLRNAMDICLKQCATSVKVAGIGASATKYSADRAYDSAKYSADTNANTQKWLFNNEIKKGILGNVFNALPNFYREQMDTEEYYTDTETGEEFSIGTDGGVEFGPLKWVGLGGAKVNWDVNNKTTYKGKTYEKHTRSTKKRTIDFDTMDALLQWQDATANGLLSNGIDPQDGYRLMNRLQSTTNSHFKALMPAIGKAFSQYTMDYLNIPYNRPNE